MTYPAPIVSELMNVTAQLQDIKLRYRKSESDIVIRYWGEGILDAAIAALKVITEE